MKLQSVHVMHKYCVFNIYSSSDSVIPAFAGSTTQKRRYTAMMQAIRKIERYAAEMAAELFPEVDAEQVSSMP